MKKIIISNSIHLLLLVFLSSCATIFSGTSDRITITTDPPNADLYIDGVLMGKSNQTIVLKRKFVNERIVNLRLEGYDDQNFVIEQEVTSAYFLNIFIGGIPMFVDIGTGAALKPKQTDFNRTLIKSK